MSEADLARRPNRGLTCTRALHVQLNRCKHSLSAFSFNTKPLQVLEIETQRRAEELY
jgi:hypothetical protein